MVICFIKQKFTSVPQLNKSRPELDLFSTGLLFSLKHKEFRNYHVFN